MWILILLLSVDLFGLVKVPSTVDQVSLTLVADPAPPLPDVECLAAGVLQKLDQVVFVVVVGNVGLW